MKGGDQLDLFGDRAPTSGGRDPALSEQLAPRARGSSFDRRPPARDRPVRHELVELPGLEGNRLFAPDDDGGPRPRRPRRVRAASAAQDRRHRPRLLRPDSWRGSRTLRRAAPEGLPVLRQGARSRDGPGAHEPARRARAETQPRLPERRKVRRRDGRPVSRGLPRAHGALHPPDASGAQRRSRQSPRVSRRSWVAFSKPFPGRVTPSSCATRRS